MTKLERLMGVTLFAVSLHVSTMAQNTADSDDKKPERVDAPVNRSTVDSTTDLSDTTDLEELTRIIHHTRGASLCLRHHSTFASFANTESIRSVTKSTVMSNPYAIRSLSGELSRLKAEVAALRAETQAKDAKLEQLTEENTTRLDELDSAVTSVAADEKRFLLYGFYDLSLLKTIPNENSILKGLAPEETSFAMSNVNFYFRSEMTQTLLSSIELRFTFLPLGHESSLELEGVSEYERVDTTVTAPNSYREYRMGGVGIERAHLTWQPDDSFGVLAGYFPTPYGIWYIDHGRWWSRIYASRFSLLSRRRQTC